MADYKRIKGFKIQSASSDPSNPIEGQIWYNSTSATLKGYSKAGGIPAGVWSAGGTLNDAREQGAAFGTLTAGVAVGGGNPGLWVEEYNGTSWTEMTEFAVRVVGSGATGTATAGIIYGTGHLPSSGDNKDAYTYNGTSWTQTADINTGRNVGGSAGGLQTSALYAGGSTPTAWTDVAETEIWNGTSWIEVNDLNDGRYYLKGGGTTTAAVLAGGAYGDLPVNPTQSEQWNGTNWTEGDNLNSGRAFLTGGGSQFASCLIFGGGPPITGNTEFWNGTSWTEMNDMATASETSFGTTQSTGLSTYRARTPAGGETEEWTVDAATATVTVS